MNKAFIAFACIIATVLAAGPTSPYVRDFVCREEGEKVVDANNMCWFHVCTLNKDSSLSLTAFVCALGSKVSYNFVRGKSNPCTVNFDNTIGYECDRAMPSVDGPPPCHSQTVCLNGGTATYESDKCWCECPPTWRGNYNCDLPTREVKDLPPASNICVDGEPLQNWCASNPCLNNGKCFNQCDTFWCDCPNRDKVDYWGKRCENKPVAG